MLKMKDMKQKITTPNTQKEIPLSKSLILKFQKFRHMKEVNTQP